LLAVAFFYYYFYYVHALLTALVDLIVAGKEYYFCRPNKRDFINKVIQIQKTINIQITILVILFFISLKVKIKKIKKLLMTAIPCLMTTVLFYNC